MTRPLSSHLIRDGEALPGPCRQSVQPVLHKSGCRRTVEIRSPVQAASHAYVSSSKHPTAAGDGRVRNRLQDQVVSAHRAALLLPIERWAR